MYHYIVKKKLQKAFSNVNKGDYAAVIKEFTDENPEHWFSGSHPLGGKRTNIKDITRWYDRLAVLFPDLRFEITNIAVQGTPGNTVAFVEWKDYLTDRNGVAYSNNGVHVIRIKWSKITSLKIYCDTQLIDSIFEQLARQGVGEAKLAPIVSQ